MEFSVVVPLEATLAPNPAMGKAILVIKNSPCGKVNFSLWKSAGKPLATGHSSIIDVEHHEIFDLSGMNPGVYLVQVQSGIWDKYLKLVKK